VVVAVSGLTNALIQLGHPEALVETSYGRILAVKISLVGLIAFVSYLHAMRLRPRLVSSNPHPPKRSERRHWRLISAEPVLAVGVVGAVAFLAAFPLPPSQVGEADGAEASAACDPCPLPEPKPDELAVAERAGSRIAAFWLRRDGSNLEGTVRLLDAQAKPIDAPIRLLGGNLTPCGLGCWRLPGGAAGDRVTVSVTENGRTYRASVPSGWEADANTRARRLLDLAQRTMRNLKSFRESERTTSGPGSFASVDYQLVAPDRMRYVTGSGSRSVVVGGRQWTRTPGQPWTLQEFGGGLPFRTRTWFRWTPYARTVRALGEYRRDGRKLVRIALMDPATPVWFRLTIDGRSGRVLSDRMITKAHFMSRRYFAFDQPQAVTPPRGVRPRP
jgi:hypothetical protein